MSDLCYAGARELAALIRTRSVSAREVMAAHLARINRLNPTLNAIVAKLDDEECLAHADEADRRLARGDEVGPLHGLPWAFKDLEDAVGFPNTAGSPIFKDRMPAVDSPIVALLRAAGVVPIGKTSRCGRRPAWRPHSPTTHRSASTSRDRWPDPWTTSRFCWA
jgi:amidase